VTGKPTPLRPRNIIDISFEEVKGSLDPFQFSCFNDFVHRTSLWRMQQVLLNFILVSDAIGLTRLEIKVPVTRNRGKGRSNGLVACGTGYCFSTC
jgi:hypothetical protein